VRSYVVKDGQLFLSLMADGGICGFGLVEGAKVRRLTFFHHTRGVMPAPAGAHFGIVLIRCKKR